MSHGEDAIRLRFGAALHRLGGSFLESSLSDISFQLDLAVGVVASQSGRINVTACEPTHHSDFSSALSGFLWSLRDEFSPFADDRGTLSLQRVILAARAVGDEMRAAVAQAFAAGTFRLYVQADSTSSLVEVERHALPGTCLSYEDPDRVVLADGSTPLLAFVEPRAGHPARPRELYEPATSDDVKRTQELLDEMVRLLMDTPYPAEKVVAYVRRELPNMPKSRILGLLTDVKKRRSAQAWLVGGRHRRDDDLSDVICSLRAKELPPG